MDIITKRRVILIISVMIVFLFFSKYSIAKIQSDTTITVNSQVVQPILTVEKNSAIKINGKKEKEYYNFKVKNYKENGEVTSIDLVYSIQILFKTLESISFQLYKNDKQISLYDNKTQKMNLSHKEKQEDSYKLVIIYQKGKNISQEYITQDVQIKIHCEQMKFE